MTDPRPTTIEEAILALATVTAFRPADVGFAHGCAARIRMKVNLTDEAKRRAWRLLAGYKPQLAELGLDYSTITEPAGTDGPAVAPPTGGRQMIGRSRVWVEDGVMRMRSPYEARLIVKTQILAAEWSKKRKVYELPATPQAALSIANALGQYGIDADDAATALVKQGHEGKKAQAKRSALDLPPVPGSKTDAWNHQRQAFWFMREMPGGILDMEMGCVSGDSVVHVTRSGATVPMPIRELHMRLTGEWPTQRGWDTTIPTHVRGQRDDGTLGQVRLLASKRTGVLPTLRLTLASGRSIRCTYDHEVATPTGKVEARLLAVGSLVLAQRPAGDRFVDKDGYVRLRGLGDRNGVYEHRFVAEAMLGRPLRDDEEVHHVDFDRANNHPSNLRVMLTVEHKRLHAEDRRAEAGRFGGSDHHQPVDLGLPQQKRGGRPPLVAEPVVRIEDAGHDEVFDLSVDAAPHTYVADGVVVSNTGKSKVVCDLIHDSGAESALIVCPERVVGVWPKQFGLHSGGDKHIIDPRRQNRKGEWVLLPIAKRVELYEHALHECRCGLPHILISNYAAAAHEPFKSWSQQQHFNYLAYDECHRLRGHGGVWSKWARDMHPRADRRLGGTGTMQAQTPLDVFGQARAVEPGLFGSTFTAFKSRYAIFGGFESRQFQGMNPMYEEEFVQKLASFVYRAGEEVLDLPELMPDVDVPGQLSARARKAYRDLEEDMYAEVARVLESGVEEIDEVTAPNVLVKILRCMQLTGGALPLDSGQIEMIDRAKRDLLADELADFRPDEPVVVFAKFTHDLNMIQEVAAELDDGRGRPYAELSGRRSDALAEDATLAEGVSVAGVQIQAGGTGVDFTRAAYGIYYSVGHSLADYLQSRKRLHRPGQTRAVRFRHLIMEGTIDVDVYEALAARKSLTDHIAEKVRVIQARGGR